MNYLIHNKSPVALMNYKEPSSSDESFSLKIEPGSSDEQLKPLEEPWSSGRTGQFIKATLKTNASFLAVYTGKKSQNSKQSVLFMKRKRITSSQISSAA